MEIGLDVITVVAFFALVGALLIIDRKNVEFSYGLIIRRWKRGQYVMDRWIFSHRKFLEIFGTVGVILGLVASIGGLASIVYSSTLNQQSVSPILPTVGGFQYPGGVIGVPFWFWIISIFVILTVHEPMHAIFARLAGVPVRSWGVMTLLVLPLGAFVDPDMKKVYKLKFWQKMKIFAGGSFGNFLAGAVVAVVLFSMSHAFFGFGTTPGGPAALAGLQGQITGIDGKSIASVSDISPILKDIPAGTTIPITTDKGTYSVTTATPPSGVDGSYIGIWAGLNPIYADWAQAILTLYQLFFWLFIFNVGVGIFNMLPLKPFDGGHMFEAIFARIFKSDVVARRAVHITSIVVAGIILFNIFGTNIIKVLLVG